MDELVGRLTGSARDVIKIWLLNNAQVSDSDDVEAVARILGQHFDSAVYAGVPLADFHSDWIGLNKADKLG